MKKVLTVVLVCSFSGVGSTYAVEDTEALALSFTNALSSTNSEQQVTPTPWISSKNHQTATKDAETEYASEQKMDKLNAQMSDLGAAVHDQLNRSIQERFSY